MKCSPITAHTARAKTNSKNLPSSLILNAAILMKPLLKSQILCTLQHVVMFL